MRKQMCMAGALLAVVALAGCAGFPESEDRVDSDPAVVARFDGNWKVEKQVFQKGELVSTQTGTAVCEMVGPNARLWSSDLNWGILFGIRQDGEYVLIDLDAARDHMLVGKDVDEGDEEEGEAQEVNGDLDLKFGRGLFGEIEFTGNDTIEISYFKEHHDREVPVEKLFLTRVR